MPTASQPPAVAAVLGLVAAAALAAPLLRFGAVQLLRLAPRQAQVLAAEAALAMRTADVMVQILQLKVVL